MPNVTVDDVRVAESDGSDPQSVLDATARAVRSTIVDAAGVAVDPTSVAVTSLPDVTIAEAPAAVGTEQAATTQVTAHIATSTAVVAARTGRSLVHIKNLDPIYTVYISDTSPAGPSNSYHLLSGEDDWWPTSAALYCRAAGGAPVLSVVEFY